MADEKTLRGAARTVYGRISQAYPADPLPAIKVRDIEGYTAHYIPNVSRYENGSVYAFGESITVTPGFLAKFPDNAIGAMVAHEAGHDILNHAGTNDVSRNQTTGSAPGSRKAKECAADHFAARFTSREEALTLLQTVQKTYGGPLLSIGSGPDHPSTNNRIKAIRGYSDAILDTPTEQIVFRDNCTIADVLPPGSTPHISGPVSTSRRLKD
jgi:hypothetical protein